MNQERKELWVKALRSGEYSQGRGFLHQGNSFCCLGVACDLHSKKTGSKDWREEIPKSSGRATIYNYFGDEIELPELVIDWLGFKEAQFNAPKVIITAEQRDKYGIGRITSLGLDTKFNYPLYYSLPVLNDAGMPFSEIADLIEAQL